MKFTVEASLQGAGCIRFDDDGSSVVKLTCDGSQLPQVTKLLLLQGRTFTVKVETEGKE
jgi:hypothetical protein